jgi:hypothetical protein
MKLTLSVRVVSDPAALTTFVSSAVHEIQADNDEFRTFPVWDRHVELTADHVNEDMIRGLLAEAAHELMKRHYRVLGF